MFYEITAEPGCVRATLFGRETVEETREFFGIVVAEIRQRGSSAGILLDVRLSRPLFHVEPDRFFEEFRKLSAGASCKIALLGDTPELRLSHEYLALLARQRGMNVWSFRTENSALKWLADRRQGQERRSLSTWLRGERGRPAPVQRRHQERRIHIAGPQTAF
jgi:hypothetical protein